MMCVEGRSEERVTRPGTSVKVKDRCQEIDGSIANVTLRCTDVRLRVGNDVTRIMDVEREL